MHSDFPRDERLVDKYRPRRIRDLIAQDSARERLEAAIVRRRGSLERTGRNNARGVAFLVYGPAGVGKTSLSRILAAAFQCLSPGDSAEPCGSCPLCRGFQRTPPRHSSDYLELNASEHSGVDAMQGILETLRTAPRDCSFRVVLLDEAQGLSSKAFDASLKLLEEPPPWSIVILITTEPGRIKSTVRSRCHEIALRPAAPADCLRLARRVCEGESFRYEIAALDLLAEMCGGNLRGLVHAINEIVASGMVTEAAARRHFRLDAVEDGFILLEDLFGGHLDRAIERLASWAETPDRKRQWLEDLLTDILMRDVLRLSQGRHAFATIANAQRAALVRQMSRHASMANISLDAFVEGLAHHWRPDGALVSEATLARRVVGFHRLVGPVATADELDTPKAVSSPEALAAARRARRPSGGSQVGIDVSAPNAEYLGRAQVRAIWDRATLMAQEHGRLFNLVAEIAHAGCGPLDHRRASCRITNLGRRLSAFLGSRGGTTLHWIYLHEADSDGRLTTVFLASIEPRRLAVVEARIKTSFIVAAASETPAPGIKTCDATARAERVAFHHRALLRLSRGIDPRIEDWDGDGRRRPLVELLGVPPRKQKTLGALGCPQRYGASDSLGPSARAVLAAEGMDILSPFADRAWSWLGSGWELDEHEDRQRERAERAAANQRTDELFPEGGSALEQTRREAEKDRLRARIALTPRDRARSSTLWWPPRALRCRSSNSARPVPHPHPLPDGLRPSPYRGTSP